MRLVNSTLGAAAFAVIMMSSCKNVDFKKTKGGMPYKLFASKSGAQIKPGNFIKVNFTQKLNDSVLFTTYDKAPAYFPVSEQTQPYDISEVLLSLKEGDSLYAVQMVDTFMKRSPGMLPPNFKKGDKLVSTLKVLKVFTSAEDSKRDEAAEREAQYTKNPVITAQLAKDAKIITDYLSKNGINAQKTGLGTYVQIVQPGQGPKVEKGKFVSLRYTGTSFSGKQFDSNMDGKKPTLDYLVGEPGMIKGFSEGILGLNLGTKARLFIPSALAYGAQPPSPDIAPNENLIFDIEVVNVSDTPPQPTNMPPPPTATDTAHQH